MRKYISILIGFLFFLCGCNPKEKYILSAEEWEAINSYRIFDIEEFNSKLKNESFGYQEVLYDSIIIHKKIYEDGYLLVVDSVYEPIRPFVYRCFYYPSGTLKKMNKHIRGNYIPYGKHYSFDEKGNVIDVKSYNEDLTFGIFELIAYLKQEGINYYNDPISDKLLEDENGKKRWRVSIKKIIDEEKWKIDNTHARILELDAYTGVLLVDSIRYFRK